MKDNVLFDGKWEFNRDVVRCFADMLERSIPDYRQMRSLVYSLGERYIRPNTWLVDIGCSTGLATQPFLARHKDELSFFMCDNSPDMLAECSKMFKVECAENVTFQLSDFWDVEMPRNTSLCLSILSLQFMPTSYRQAMINTVYDRLIPGGAFIFVEKVIGDARMDDVFVDLYYQMKNLNGYSYEKIMNKKKSLENVLSPLKAEWNADMLRTVGFGNIDMFWRCLNFCGFVAVK